MKLRYIFKRIKWFLLLGFIVTNIVAYNHAYRFTHFSSTDGIRTKPEDLSFSQKMKILFLGVDNPKPINKILPSRTYETITLKSHEGLEGWMIEEENHKGVVILFHGYSGSKSGNISYANEFSEKGYSTLLIDFMGSGGSEGNQTTIGFKESRDVKASFDFIKQRYPDKDIILFGSSMGAVSIMKAIVEYDISPDKIIIECPFGSMKKTVKQRFEAMNIPSFAFAELLLFYGGMQNGFNSFTHNPTEYAKEIDIPTLLLYGKKDNRVTLSETETIFENLKGPKKLQVLNESGHQNYLVNNKDDWTSSVDAFLAK